MKSREKLEMDVDIGRSIMRSIDREIAVLEGKRRKHLESVLEARRALTAMDRAEQEEQEDCGCADHAPPGEYYRCPKCDAEWPPEEGGE